MRPPLRNRLLKLKALGGLAVVIAFAAGLIAASADTWWGFALGIGSGFTLTFAVGNTIQAAYHYGKADTYTDLLGLMQRFHEN